MTQRRAALPDTLTEPPFDLDGTGRDLYAATAPLAWADREHDYAWAKYTDALGELLDVIAEMVRDDADGNPGWTALASPARCPEPFLRVLAQWAGIRRWDALSSDDLRDLIGPRAPGLWRGTREAMLAAVRRYLPPDSTDLLRFDERADGDPYKLRVFTYRFVDHDPELVRAALEAAKPAGLTLIYEVRDGQSYDQLNSDCMNYAAMKGTYRDYAEVYSSMPGRCGLYEPPLNPITVTPPDLPIGVTYMDIRLNGDVLADLTPSACEAIVEGLPWDGLPIRSDWTVGLASPAMAEEGQSRVYVRDQATGTRLTADATLIWTAPYATTGVDPPVMSRAAAQGGYTLDLIGTFPGNAGALVQIGGLGIRESSSIERVSDELIRAYFTDTPPPQNGVGTVGLRGRVLATGSGYAIGAGTTPITWTN